MTTHVEVQLVLDKIRQDKIRINFELIVKGQTKKKKKKTPTKSVKKKKKNKKKVIILQLTVTYNSIMGSAPEHGKMSLYVT